MVIAILPGDTSVEQIAAVDGISPGVVSAGIGIVPATQTYLDITQGNRINETLYRSDLPLLQIRDGRLRAESWDEAVERAEEVPADVIPGVLAATLAGAGVPVAVEADIGLASLIAIDRQGTLPPIVRAACASGRCPPGVTVIEASRAELGGLVQALAPGDLLVTLAAAPARDGHLLPAGIAGSGFDGTLTSDSTRTDGVVVSTDIAPTVLQRFGVEVPDEMNGSEIRSQGDRDPQAVADLQARLADRPSRSFVVLLPLVGWFALAALSAAVFRRRGARVALELLGLACAWAPLMLLAAAAVDASEPASGLLMAAGSVVLALVTRTWLAPLRGLAVACALTVGAHAIDVIAGSPLTSLSVLGPNPGGGVRFFGIGNELEATLATLTLVGTGAWLASGPERAPRRAALVFALVAVAATAAFAPGRFGADVGAAIVLGAGGATAVALCLRLSPRATVALIAAAGIAGMAALVLADLVLGGAHFSRSILGAGEAGDILDVLERRVRLMVQTFTEPVYPELLVACGLVLVLGLVRLRTVLGWFEDRWPARAGFLGAVAGVAVGTVANDSGSVLLVIGTIYLTVCAGYMWATIPRCASPSFRPTPGPTRGA